MMQTPSEATRDFMPSGLKRALSYQEWQQLGRYVRKGEKSRLRHVVNNKPLFFEHQTESKAEQAENDRILYEQMCLAPHHSQD
jgi:hypothetical protein